MKICSICGIEQEDSQFAKWRRQCRLCRNFLQRAKSKRYSKTDKGKIVKQKEYKKERKTGWDKHYLKYRGRWRHLEARYGVTEEDYKRKFAEQEGVCAICNKPEMRKKTLKNGTTQILPLSVDHNHKTGEVRGLLCNKCNSMIGYIDENIIVLANAISYLEKHKQSSPAEVLMGAG